LSHFSVTMGSIRLTTANGSNTVILGAKTKLYHIVKQLLVNSILLRKDLDHEYRFCSIDSVVSNSWLIYKISL
jgi:hypothetical protein